MCSSINNCCITDIVLSSTRSPAPPIAQETSSSYQLATPSDQGGEDRAPVAIPLDLFLGRFYTES